MKDLVKLLAAAVAFTVTPFLAVYVVDRTRRDEIDRMRVFELREKQKARIPLTEREKVQLESLTGKAP